MTEYSDRHSEALHNTEPRVLDQALETIREGLDTESRQLQARTVELHTQAAEILQQARLIEEQITDITLQAQQVEYAQEAFRNPQEHSFGYTSTMDYGRKPHLVALAKEITRIIEAQLVSGNPITAEDAVAGDRALRVQQFALLESDVADLLLPSERANLTRHLLKAEHDGKPAEIVRTLLEEAEEQLRLAQEGVYDKAIAEKVKNENPLRIQALQATLQTMEKSKVEPSDERDLGPVEEDSPYAGSVRRFD